MSPKTLKRVILEMGTGNSLQSRDYTQAAIRAVEDAMHHSSLPLLSSLDIDPQTVEIEVTIGAQEPDKVDIDAVSGALKFGHVTARAVKGGLNVPREGDKAPVVIVNAGLVVRVPV